MNPVDFNALTRRASLSRLGAASLAALAGPITGDAKKKNRKKGDVNKRCKQQAEAWITFVPNLCEGEVACQILVACATPLKTCDFTGFLVCLSPGQAELFDSASLR